MIDFSTKWCGWCKELDRTTFKATDVIQESQNFVNVRVDAEERTDLAQRYQVSGFPAIIWTDNAGTKIDSLDGFAPAPTFLQAMREAYTKFQPFITA